MDDQRNITPTYGEHSNQNDEGSQPEGANHPLGTSFPLPPDDFVPLLSNDKTLISYGFPPRPNKLTHPRQWDHWHRALSVPMRVIPATSDTTMEPLRLEKFPLPTGPTPGNKGDFASIHKSLPGCTNISASWIIPYISPPPSATGFGWDITCCIQLDPFFLAGTVSSITRGGGDVPDAFGAYAWVAWIDPSTDGTARFENATFSQLLDFANPGDAVTCLLCAPSTQSGTVFFLNTTQQRSTRLMVEDPTGNAPLTRTGGSWGVVSGSSPSPFPEVPAPLPVFNYVLFTDCAVANGGHEVGVDGGDVSDIIQDGVAVTESAVLSPGAFLIVHR